MKKMMSLVLTALLAISMAGCGGDSSAFDPSKAIGVVSREDGSGTRGAFIELFGVQVKGEDGSSKDMTTKEAVIANSTSVIMTNVAGEKYAIGYISLGSLNSTVKAVQVEGVEATANNVKNGAYPIARPFNIATKGEPSGLAKDFIGFILSADGQSVVAASYIAVDDGASAYAGDKPSGKIVVAGSSSVTPIMEKLKEAYLAINPGATIELQESDSSAGMTAAMDGTCDIGMASRAEGERACAAYADSNCHRRHCRHRKPGKSGDKSLKGAGQIDLHRSSNQVGRSEQMMRLKGAIKGLKSRSFREKAMSAVFFISALTSILSVLLICLFLLVNGLPAMHKIGLFRFLFGKEWSPADIPAVFGILPMILGSLYVTAGAILIGVPVGILTAVFLARVCPKKLYKVLKPGVELLAGIPSVVYGFFGMAAIVPLAGNSILSACILLGIMILPTIIGVAESALRAVPEPYYEGALALGAGHYRSVFYVVLPAAKSGVFASVVLGVGRAIGETMAVIMVAGNQPRMPVSLFAGARTLTANIVMEMGYAAELHREALIATGVVLFVFILIINLSFSALKRRAK